MAKTDTQADAMNELGRYPTAYFTDTYKRMGMRGLVSGLQPRCPTEGSIVGRALTARFMPLRGRRGSALKLYDVIRSGQPGDFLVIEAPYPEVVVGDLVTTCAETSGFVGILLEGMVRDLSTIQAAGIPVWSRGNGINRPGGFELSSYGEPVVCGGAQVHTGDVVVADADGAAIVPPEDLPSVLVALREMDEIERELHEVVITMRPLEELHALFDRKARPPRGE